MRGYEEGIVLKVCVMGGRLRWVDLIFGDRPARTIVADGLCSVMRLVKSMCNFLRSMMLTILIGYGYVEVNYIFKHLPTDTGRLEWKVSG